MEKCFDRYNSLHYVCESKDSVKIPLKIIKIDVRGREFLVMAKNVEGSSTVLHSACQNKTSIGIIVSKLIEITGNEILL